MNRRKFIIKGGCLLVGSFCCMLISCLNKRVFADIGQEGYKVDPELCIGCRECLEGCSFDAMEMFEDTAYIQQNLCVQCGACYRICPVKAIKTF
jgi:NAD-dependent dihydropyrimidine dehydrogenase PreA subunit